MLLLFISRLLITKERHMRLPVHGAWHGQEEHSGKLMALQRCISCPQLHNKPPQNVVA